VKRRVLKQTELLSDAQLFGAQFGAVAVVPSGMAAKLDDVVCGRANVFGQRHGALVFHGGEPGHDRVCDAGVANATCQRIDPPSSGHGSTESALARQFGTGAAIHRAGLVRQAALLFPG
jgi:hypothetical protein